MASHNPENILHLIANRCTDTLCSFILCLHVSCLFRLAEADKEVQEAYKKIALARSKKKSPSKKEKDVAWKALKDREAILKQLESV